VTTSECDTTIHYIFESVLEPVEDTIETQICNSVGQWNVGVMCPACTAAAEGEGVDSVFGCQECNGAAACMVNNNMGGVGNISDCECP
jgi:hypothetical protein